MNRSYKRRPIKTAHTKLVRCLGVDCDTIFESVDATRSRFCPLCEDMRDRFRPGRLAYQPVARAMISQNGGGKGSYR